MLHCKRRTYSFRQGDLIEITDKCARHTNIEFHSHKYAKLYYVNLIKGVVQDDIKSLGINLDIESCVKDIDVEYKNIRGILLSDNSYVKDDVLVETSSSTGLWGIV